MSGLDIVMESREWKWKMVKTAIDFVRDIIEITFQMAKEGKCQYFTAAKKRAMGMAMIPLTLRQS